MCDWYFFTYAFSYLIKLQLHSHTINTMEALLKLKEINER